MVEPMLLYQSTENSRQSPAKMGKFGIVMPKFRFTHKIIIPYKQKRLYNNGTLQY